ncbi:MAG: c-type cytochrome domain-containing protein [Bacteroidota bacterium]
MSKIFYTKSRTWVVIAVIIFTGVIVFAKQETKSVGKKAGRKVINSAVKKKPSAAPSYKKDVFPIFQRYCLPCHTEDNMNPSELYLDSYDGLIKGGKHGVPVIAGKADSSNLIRKINFKPPFGDPMPLKRKIPFPEDTLKILRDWINQGAMNN